MVDVTGHRDHDPRGNAFGRQFRIRSTGRRKVKTAGRGVARVRATSLKRLISAIIVAGKGIVSHFAPPVYMTFIAGVRRHSVETHSIR
jgi:hypothetical protein